MEKLILLVVHDDAAARGALVSRLMDDGFGNIAEAESAAQALEWMHARERPEIVIYDAAMTGTDGLKFCTTVRDARHSGVRAIPVILLMDTADPQIHAAARDAGAAAIAVGPLAPGQLAQQICGLNGLNIAQQETGMAAARALSPHERADRSILVIESDFQKRKMIFQMLRQSGWERIEEATGSAHALSLLHQGCRPSVAICNVDAHNDDWKLFSTSLRKMHIAALERLPVIFVASHNPNKLKEAALRMGTAMILVRPFSAIRLADCIEEMMVRGSR